MNASLLKHRVVAAMVAVFALFGAKTVSAAWTEGYGPYGGVNLIANGSFESLDGWTGDGGQAANEASGTTWISARSMPDGTYGYFFWHEEAVSRSFTVPEGQGGTYRLSFFCLARPAVTSTAQKRAISYSGNRVRAWVDGVEVGSKLTTYSYWEFVEFPVTLTPGEHTLCIGGDCCNTGWDASAAIDCVALELPPDPTMKVNPPTIADYQARLAVNEGLTLENPGGKASEMTVATGEVCAGPAGVDTRIIEAPKSAYERVAGIESPEGCPFEKSRAFAGVGFTRRHAEYTEADTWYPSWAADGKLYSPWTDGGVNGIRCGSGGEDAATGHATIIGDDPLRLCIDQVGTFKSSPRPYAGRYPCGSLVVGGVWYYGTYCLHPRGTVKKNGINYDWPWLGPFVGFRWSTDFGKSWHETPCTPAQPLFGEHALRGESVRLAVPHFVDFGREMQHSPDGKAYLIVQGSSDGVNRRYGYNSWITSDQAFLIRVKPSVETMNKASEYEFFAGHDAAGKPLWTRDMKQMKPLLEWRDHMGRVSMTYNPGLRKYIMCVTDGRTTAANFTTYLLEADEMTGPWRLAAYLPDFGPQAYFVNIPSKFISSDGTTMWLCYSANYGKDYRQIKRTFPTHSRYAMCLREFKFLKPDEAVFELSQATACNLVNEAQVTVSSVFDGYSAEGLRDGVVGGYPGDISAEWASKFESTTAMVRLDWDSPRTVARIQLFDRPTELAQMTGGLLVFSDGTTIRVGALPDDARQGLEIRFPPKRVKWLLLAIDAVKPGTTNVGLSEMAVFAR